MTTVPYFQDMLDAIKHTIVRLQIAKVGAAARLPLSGALVGPRLTLHFHTPDNLTKSGLSLP